MPVSVTPNRPFNWANKETSIVLQDYSLGEKSLESSSEISTVFPKRTGIRSRVQELWLKVERFRALQENWDSYGALPPSKTAIDSAIDFLRKVNQTQLPLYFAAPGVNEEVMVEFKGEGAKAAEVYFNPDGSTELLLFQDDEVELEGDLEENYPDLIQFFKP